MACLVVMKTALISDLHANRQALDAVLAHAAKQDVDEYVLLGDYVGYGGDPAAVVDRVRELHADGAVAVVGNHDLAVAEGPRVGMVEDARVAIEWTRAQLDEAQLRFLSGLPMTAQRDDCLYVHANAFDPAGFGYVQGRLEAMRSLHATDCRYTFCGHMHEPMLYHLSGTGKAGDFKPAPGMPIPLLPNRQWLVIPGACGQPRDGNPAAGYAIFDHEREELTFQRVPYDVDAAIAALKRATGLPPALAERLAHRLKVGR